MDGKVVISTALDNSGFSKDVKNVSGSLGGLKNVAGKLAGVIAAAFSVGKIVQFGKEASQAARDLSDALIGLKTVVDGNGRSFSDAQKFIDEYTADGLIPAANAVSAYKNLLQRGYDDSQIRSVMNALKDASAYGRASSYTMGEAVQSAAEGLKNENSILVDNAGVTKNVAKMWDEYAKSIGTTANNLTQEQKIQAEVNGILEESKLQTGDAAKVAGTLSGQLQQLSFNFNNLKVAIGNAINPILQAVLPAVNAAVSSFTKLANSIASVVGALFGSAKVSSSAATSANSIADANNAIADSASAGAAAQKDLAKGVSGAAKAAKKSISSFDELNTLQDNSSSGGGGGGGSGSGGDVAADGGGTSSSGSVDASTEVTDTLSPKLQALVEKIKELIAPLKSIDLGPLKDAFSGLGDSLARFGQMIGKHLEWAWYNVLVPLAEWTLEEAAPASIDLLSEALEVLTSVLDPVWNGVEKIWEKMQPFFDWIKETAIMAIEKLTEFFGEFASLMEEKGPQIEELFGDIGTAISDLWIQFEPVFTAIRDGLMLLSEESIPATIDKFGLLIDVVTGLATVILGFQTGDWDLIWKGMSQVAVGEAEYIEKRTGKLFEKLGIDISGFSESVDRATQEVSNAFSEGWDLVEEAWQNAGPWFQENVVAPIQSFFAPLLQWFSELFGGIWETVSGVFDNISVIGTGSKAILEKAWSQFWVGLKTKAAEAWAGIQSVFGTVGEWFGETFGEAWERVKKVFSTGGQVFDGIKEGIVTSFKTIVNKLISGINRVVARPFEGLNTAIRKIRSVSVMGIYPFSGLSTVSVPSIPYLAQGAVLPANKPFMAVVGDQRHGTNVEAPLATIQEAVADVVGDLVASNMAGHEAVAAVLGEILEAVLGIHIGDDVVGQAAERYQRSITIMKGV